MSVVYNVIYDVTAMAGVKSDIFLMVVVFDEIVEHMMVYAWVWREPNNRRGFENGLNRACRLCQDIAPPL